METIETPDIKDDMSDDEILMGKITLEELKKMFRKQQESEKTQAGNSKNDSNLSLTLIRTHSQPNLRSQTEDSSFTSKLGSPGVDTWSDDSFIQMASMVENLCISSRNSDNVVHNNTFEVIDYILNHGPNKVQDLAKKHDNKEKNKADLVDILPIKLTCKKEHTPAKDTLKMTEKTDLKGSPKGSCKGVTKKPFIEFIAPSPRSSKPKTSIFKTPASSSTLMKPSTSKNTTKNAYQHIKSPVASYIKNSPQTPLVITVFPKKPLPATSFIPKLDNTPSPRKIYINLPQVAYKTAKMTKVVDVPDEDKLPQSQWVEKSFPRPTVIKHEKRVINPVKKEVLSDQEDSFNMTCQQAEVSHCTQKSAFKATKKR